ncbi:hypothetical protein B0H19DRAFT_1256194 [Mycena capillaripes]|nr:hypothetical protein B0H19DRAFT_1256194 [Mycena capillaripes]
MAFPQELIDMVVDNLHDDIPSLKSCSLAARTFVSSARIHIFRKIEILPPLKPLSSRNPCQRFHKLLTSSPHIAPLVEELSVVLVGSETSFAYDDDGLYLEERHVTWVMAGRTLPLILPLLDLKRICLTENGPADWNDGGEFSMNWAKMGRQLKSALVNVFSSPRLEAVHLRGIVVESPRQMLSLFSEAISLTELSLSRVHFTQRWDQRDSWPESQVWAPRLRYLLVSDLRGDTFCRYLVNPRIDLTAVRSLKVVTDLSEWRGKLIQATKAGVEHLRLWSTTGASYFPQSAQKLWARIYAPSTSTPSRSSDCSAHSSRPPRDTRLEYITFEGYARIPMPGPFEFDAAIDSTVAQLRFLKMVEIATQTVHFDSFYEYASAVRATLPSLEGRGMLRVTETHWSDDDAHHGWE